MNRQQILVALALTVYFTAAAAAQPKPGYDPSSTHIFPAGGQRGSQVEGRLAELEAGKVGLFGRPYAVHRDADAGQVEVRAREQQRGRGTGGVTDGHGEAGGV